MFKRPNFGKLSSEVKDLLTGLLKKDPKKRLGYGSYGVDDIKKHSWFKDMNFEALINKNIKPPLKPSENIDRNFYIKFIKEKPKDSLVDSPEFTPVKDFLGFNY